MIWKIYVRTDLPVIIRIRGFKNMEEFRKRVRIAPSTMHDLVRQRYQPNGVVIRRMRRLLPGVDPFQVREESGTSA